MDGILFGHGVGVGAVGWFGAEAFGEVRVGVERSVSRFQATTGGPSRSAGKMGRAPCVSCRQKDGNTRSREAPHADGCT